MTPGPRGFSFIPNFTVGGPQASRRQFYCTSKELSTPKHRTMRPTGRRQSQDSWPRLLGLLCLTTLLHVRAALLPAEAAGICF